jgi:hypothetical protein
MNMVEYIYGLHTFKIRNIRNWDSNLHALQLRLPAASWTNALLYAF